ncbi:Hsp20/alpha crystallin family protein [Halodesulfurarchaeum sp.]|uniref:Hsp20/alpha crystallin family protein n=1 Tax=Halodesulfurarchaeum sp. TaxID=1980530 RepID=UPI001BC265E3|nr:Hsp20/alpha crystallin family protein [Halodesulfurarchaeum sp.]
MTPDDRDDPFDDIFREIERMMNDMVGTAGPQEGEAPGVQATSPTHVDVYEDDDLVRVIADLPGVSRDDISVQCDGEYVTVSARNDSRTYDERVALPAPVDPETGSGTYNNGVLEITFDRSQSTTDIDIE